MLYTSSETPEATERRLLKVISAATVTVYDGTYIFEESPVDGPPPGLDDRTIALVRDDDVWSRLVRAGDRQEANGFGLVRFHFPEGKDNSGFVGWLATHLKRELGTGVFVVCGQNSARGGIFDYTGFPVDLRETILARISALQAAGRALAASESRARAPA